MDEFIHSTYQSDFRMTVLIKLVVACDSPILLLKTKPGIGVRAKAGTKPKALNKGWNKSRTKVEQ